MNRTATGIMIAIALTATAMNSFADDSDTQDQSTPAIGSDQTIQGHLDTQTEPESLNTDAELEFMKFVNCHVLKLPGLGCF